MPDFNFNGRPLKAGKIPASVALVPELKAFCTGLSELKIDVAENNGEQASAGSNDGIHNIKIEGKTDNVKVKGDFVFNKGIMRNGELSLEISLGNDFGIQPISMLITLTPVD